VVELSGRFNPPFEGDTIVRGSGMLVMIRAGGTQGSDTLLGHETNCQTLPAEATVRAKGFAVRETMPRPDFCPAERGDNSPESRPTPTPELTRRCPPPAAGHDAADGSALDSTAADHDGNIHPAAGHLASAGARDHDADAGHRDAGHDDCRADRDP
jgi:hypothetical protein